MARDDALIEGIAEQVDAINADEEVMAMIFTMQDEIELQADLAYEKGEAEGEARLSRLIDMLFGADRIEDAKRVVTDPAYREQLFEEFAIA